MQHLNDVISKNITSDEDEGACTWPDAQHLLAPWQAAARPLWREIAALEFELGRLAERLALAPNGFHTRLAINEALDLGGWQGDYIMPDRYHLWACERIGADGSTAPSYARVAWAAQTLVAPQADDCTTLLHLLGDQPEHAAALMACPGFLQGAVLFHMLGSSPERSRRSQKIGTAVSAMRQAAPKGLTWMPLARGQYKALQTIGSLDDRLRLWCEAAIHSTQVTLSELDNLARWQVQAKRIIQGLSGRVPGLLLGAIAQHPVLDAQTAAQVIGASRTAVERNFALFTSRGITRELSGQDAFRVWCANLTLST